MLAVVGAMMQVTVTSVKEHAVTSVSSFPYTGMPMHCI